MVQNYVTKNKIKNSHQEKYRSMHLEQMHRCNVPVTDICWLEKIANGIIVKGSVY